MGGRPAHHPPTHHPPTHHRPHHPHSLAARISHHLRTPLPYLVFIYIAWALATILATTVTRPPGLTGQPTRYPALATMSSPTYAPTFNPTKNPTTKTPTKNPTTKTPTNNPTNNPTKNPTTKSPTTSSPTNNPTKNPTATGVLYFYSDSVIRTGALGDRTATDTTCNGMAEKPVGCRAVTMLLSYTGDAVSDFPTRLSFSPSASVYGPTSIPIGVWSTILSDSGTVLTNYMYTAGVVTDAVYPAYYYWTGSTRTGGVLADICTEWSSSSGGVNGGLGSPNAVTGSWIARAGVYACNSPETTVICVCVMDTALPTSQPTSKPTTAAPT
jgi:hypothetical protein